MRYFHVERHPVDGHFDDLAAVSQAANTIHTGERNRIIAVVPDDAVIPDNGRWVETTAAVFLARRTAVTTAAGAEQDARDAREQEREADGATLDVLFAKRADATPTAGELQAALRTLGVPR